MLKKLLPLSLLLALASCAAGAGERAHTHQADGDEDEDDNDGVPLRSEQDIRTSSAALSETDPVSKAVAESCSTTSVRGLATQLVDEIQCLRPGSMAKIDQVPGLSLGAAVFPYLQTPAAEALATAQKARGGGAGGVTLSINSGLRTLPQQYLLYRWYQTKRCGIGLAASPGTSNHESAIAVDIQDSTGWRTAMQAKGFRWLGASDPVHYDFTGSGAIDLRGLSVKAFQRLWNRNHPDDTIPEDSAYGAETEKRLAQSPSGGFPKGANCNDPSSTPAMPGQPAPADLPSTPDATEPNGDDSSSPSSTTSSEAKKGDEASSSSPSPRSHSNSNGASGCSISSVGEVGPHDVDIAGALGFLAIGCTLMKRRTRKARSAESAG